MNEEYKQQSLHIQGIKSVKSNLLVVGCLGSSKVMKFPIVKIAEAMENNPQYDYKSLEQAWIGKIWTKISSTIVAPVRWTIHDCINILDNVLP